MLPRDPFDFLMAGVVLGAGFFLEPGPPQPIVQSLHSTTVAMALVTTVNTPTLLLGIALGPSATSRDPEA